MSEPIDVSLYNYLEKVQHPVTVYHYRRTKEKEREGERRRDRGNSSVTHERDEVSTRIRQSSQDTLNTLSEYETEADTGDEKEKNVLKRNSLDPSIVHVPAGGVPTLAEVGTASYPRHFFPLLSSLYLTLTNLTEEIRPYLDVYLVNSKLLDPVIPTMPTSTFSTIAQDRSALEAQFADRMERFKASILPPSTPHKISARSSQSSIPDTPATSTPRPKVLSQPPAVSSAPLSAPVVSSSQTSSQSSANKRKRPAMGF
jgi:hypothetical protein